MSPIVVLVGVPGAGKTTVGKQIADQLGVEFADTDQLIEADRQATVADIFVDEGEDAFRAYERQTVAQAARDHSGVLALGGGAVMADETRAVLNGLPVVWLTVETDEAASRVGLNAARPMLLGNVRGRMRELAAQREPLYAEVATITVATDGKPVDQIAREVIAELGVSA